MTLPLMTHISLRWIDLIDIAIVAFIIYYILLWIQGTRAVPLIRGLFLLLLVFAYGRLLGFFTINWLFDKFAAAVVIMLVILFQPELRRTLEKFGRGRLFGKFFIATPSKGTFHVRHIVKAVEQMAEEKIGALIVIERASGLNEYLESGIRLDAILSLELLLSIFELKSPLHDGAVVVQGERIAAAGCLLPISDSRVIEKRVGTRHRAAVGISEISDAIVIVVSEKTGTVSMAENGYLTRHVTREMLEEKLFSLYKTEKGKVDFPWQKQ